MKRPDFIMAGTTRSGANTLLHILGNHPRIFIPHVKTHRYFTQGGLTKNLTLSCKRDFFEAARLTTFNENSNQNGLLFGEKQYKFDLAAQECPNAKIIFTLRDPVERACRLYYWARARKTEFARKFETAINEEIEGKRSPNDSNICWIHKNRYELHIKQWLSRFPKENVLFLIYEEWTAIDYDGLKSLEEFLGLDAGSLVEQYNENFNAKEWINILRDRKPPKYKPVPTRFKKRLEKILSPDKEYIYSLLNREIPDWK